MSLNIAVDERGDADVIAIDGELDLATAPELSAALDARLVAGRRVIVADLSQLTFCDSSGLRVFVRIRRELLERGGRFALAAPVPIVRRVLEVSGLDGVLGCHPTVDAALAVPTPQLNSE
jgi:anti-sigma B factor antagonist